MVRGRARDSRSPPRARHKSRSPLPGGIRKVRSPLPGGKIIEKYVNFPDNHEPDGNTRQPGTPGQGKLLTPVELYQRMKCGDGPPPEPETSSMPRKKSRSPRRKSPERSSRVTLKPAEHQKYRSKVSPRRGASPVRRVVLKSYDEVYPKGKAVLTPVDHVKRQAPFSAERIKALADRVEKDKEEASVRGELLPKYVKRRMAKRAKTLGKVRN